MPDFEGPSKLSLYRLVSQIDSSSNDQNRYLTKVKQEISEFFHTLFYQFSI